MPLLWTPSHIIYDQTLPGNATNIDVANLNYNNDGPWQVYITAHNPQGGGAYLRLLFNGDYTVTNYYAQWMSINGGARASGRVQAPNISYLGPNISAILSGVIMVDPLGYARSRFNICRKPATSIELYEYGTCKTSTVANITSLRITTSIANGLGTGTRLILTRIAH